MFFFWFLPGRINLVPTYREKRPHVDGPYLVTFCCLLPYTTQIHKAEVETFVRLQIYMKKP